MCVCVPARVCTGHLEARGIMKRLGPMYQRIYQRMYHRMYERMYDDLEARGIMK